MNRVIVTGAAGFVGRHLIPLLRDEFELVPTSRRQYPGVVQVENYVEVPEGDLLIHLAEESDRGAVSRAGEAFVERSVKLAEALSARFQRRIIYASSGLVYGDKSELPCRVDAPVFAVDAYSRAKLLGEKAVLDAGGTVVRLANLFGPGMSAGNIMSDILRQTPGKGPLEVRDAAPIRDFLAVSDAAAAIALLAKSELPGIVNVGSGIGTSVRNLAKIALALAGEDEREIVATCPSPQRSINVLDISETSKTLGWTPSLSLKDFMKNALLYLGRIN
jgi:UDP-glucose 4-epimerase